MESDKMTNSGSPSSMHRFFRKHRATLTCCAAFVLGYVIAISFHKPGEVRKTKGLDRGRNSRTDEFGRNGSTERRSLVPKEDVQERPRQRSDVERQLNIQKSKTVKPDPLRLSISGDQEASSISEPVKGNFRTLAISGAEFSGNRTRQFPAERRRFSAKDRPGVKCDASEQRAENLPAPRCGENWAVMTTVFTPPTEAVRRFLGSPDWCLVVVGDKGKPKNYVFESSLGDNIVFLSDEDQKSIRNAFVDALPWRNFGRKNVGYLYAIARGARVLWDFDDDNLLKFWMKGAAPDPNMDLESYIKRPERFGVVEPDRADDVFSYNPYPNLGAPDFPTWPRGLPLIDILKRETYNLTLRPVAGETVKFGVLQSPADVQPDIDAIYRLTKKTPVNFKRPDERVVAPSLQGSDYTFKPKPIIRVPLNRMSPYNAQATIHFYDAFWALYLPVTVPGRVSDILRSYAAQALFPRLGLSLGFLPRPIVVQDRNPHSIMGDFEAESPLYSQSGAMVEHLARNYMRKKEDGDFLETFESLWIDLYERNYLELNDVINIQHWIESLLSVGYKFPGRHVGNLCAQRDAEEKNRIRSAGKSLKRLSVAMAARKSKASCAGKAVFASADLSPATKVHLAASLSAIGQETLFIGTGGKPKILSDGKKLSGVSILPEVAPVLASYLRPSDKQPTGVASSLYDFYKNDVRMKKVDAFVCSLPASTCAWWTGFEKATVFLPAHRYNLGRCSADEWRSLDDQLNSWAKKSRNFIGVTNRYDLEYLRYYTGMKTTLIPYATEYFSEKGKEGGDKDSVLIVASNVESSFVVKTQNSLKPNVKTRLVPTAKFELWDVARHRAAVVFPDSIFDLSVVELYSVAVPLFLPSPKFFLTQRDDVGGGVGFGRGRTAILASKCPNGTRLEASTRPGIEDGFSEHPYSPNLSLEEDAEAEMYWLQFADWYEMPHVGLFDDFVHLKKLLHAARLDEIAKGMREELAVVETRSREGWCEIAKRVKGGG